MNVIWSPRAFDRLDKIGRRTEIDDARAVRTGGAISLYCVVIHNDGRREVDEATYRQISANAESYDLFLDLMHPIGRSRHRACGLDAEAFYEGSLTHQQAWACAELMETRCPMRASQLKALSSVGSPHKQVEAARRVLDVKVGRYEWRATERTVAEDVSYFRFSAPKSLLFKLCCLQAPSHRT